MAFVIVIFTMICEYVFRHYIMFWFPVIGNLHVNDMISLFLGYLLLTGLIVLIKHVDLHQEWNGIWQALKYFATTWSGAFWILIMVIFYNGFGILDKIFLARFTLPMYLSPFRNSTVLLEEMTPYLSAISLILVNGFFVPIAEEFLWRGLVQARLIKVISPSLAIGITAILFLFKHVLVDASFGRFTAIIVFGIICGIIAYQKSWRTSAALHIIINTTTTLGGLIMLGHI